MKVKNKRFQMRMTARQRAVLKELADRKGLSSAGYILEHIQKEAKRLGLGL